MTSTFARETDAPGAAADLALPAAAGNAPTAVSWHPGVRVVYAVAGEGFAEDGAVDDFGVGRPIQPSELAAKVREVLDG